jgi:predicted ATPase
MAARARVPVWLLRGFPGGGETSLLARRLRAPGVAGAEPPRCGLTIIARTEQAGDVGA